MKSDRKKKSILTPLRPLTGRIILFILLALIATVCDLGMPAIMGMIVNDGIDKQNFDVVWHMCLIMTGVALAGFLLTFCCVKLATKIVTEYTRSARSMLYGHAMDMPLSDFQRIGTGALLTRSTQDTHILQDALGMFMQAVVTVPVLIIGGSVLSLLVDPYISLIIFAVSPVIIVATYFLGKKLMPLYERSNEYIDKQNKIVAERLSGIRVIRAFNKEEQEHGRMKRATEVMANNIIKANVAFGLMTPVAMLIINLITVTVLSILAARAQNGVILRTGDIIAVIQYAGLIMGAIFSSAYTFMMIPRLRVSIKRMNEILSVAPVPRGETVEGLSGALVCKDLTFCYPDSERPALSDISFEIMEGEKVALIGGTGSGKTTLLMILAGLYPKTGGSLTFGAADYDTLTIDDLNKAFRVVYQKHDIFSGTLRENLDPESLYGDDKIFEALATAQLDVFARENGLDYMLNQAGSNLSGGQKQRLCIARALLKPASVYMFDDSFSSLDYLTEQKLRAELMKAMRGKTVIISTQRVATARNCGQIIVFDGGRAVDSGTHKDLIERCGIYREIYITQTGGVL